MAGKRQATIQLNHDNWNDDLEPEEKGDFARASETELKNRVIKKARRNVVNTTEDANSKENGSKSVFSGFAGFGTAATTSKSTVASTFSFLSKLPAGNPESSTTSNSTSTSPKFSFVNTNIVNVADTAKSNSSNGNDKSANYYAKVRSLNQAVSDWIKTHVDKNPLCILTPIFKDYEKHLSDIDRDELKETNIDKVNSPKQDGQIISKPSTTTTSSLADFKFSATPTNSSTSASASASTSSVSKPTSSAPFFSFGTTTKSAAPTTSIFGGISKSASSEQSKTNDFSFGIKAGGTTSDVSSPSKGFSFGIKSDDKSSTAVPAFSFGKPLSSENSNSAASEKDKQPKVGFGLTPGSTPFTFANIQPPVATTSDNTEEEGAEDEPPKVEFTQVVEKDAVFSKKCKVFVKKDGNFADRGVGTLYLKPVKDSDKTQLIVRADTNLGNLLANLILSAGIPVQRMGKNNVMMICIPTPDIEKPTSLLLRVKTGEEADELLEKIEKCKK